MKRSKEVYLKRELQYWNLLSKTKRWEAKCFTDGRKTVNGFRIAKRIS